MTTALALRTAPSAPLLSAGPAAWLNSGSTGGINGPCGPLGPAEAAPLARKFANAEIVIHRSAADEMAVVARALEELMRLPAYIAAAPDAGFTTGIGASAAGIFNALDFHLTPDGPRLIEANTNGGGAFLLALLDELSGRQTRQQWQDRLFSLFLAEWRNARPGRRLQRVAIVDDSPDRQFLHDEFVLAAHMLRQQGIDALLLDPRDLEYRYGALQHNGQVIDFVYNRLTRFGLDGDADGPLAAAYEDGAVLVSPNPRVHALWASKRNLATWCDPAKLRSFGLSGHYADTLAASVPLTTLLTPENAEALWQRRDGLYFKPADGHASKGVYAGAKITRGVWETIKRSDYVAQERINPPMIETPAGAMKADIRVFVWNGEIVIMGARLFRGQTMNFRTPGGGFARVQVSGVSPQHSAP